MLLLPPLAFAQQLETEHISGRETAAREVLIKLRPGTTLQQLAQEFDAEMAQPVGNSGLVRLRSRSLNAATLVSGASRSPLAVWAEPNYIIRVSDTVPNDLNFGDLWGMRNTAQTINGQTGLPFADIEAVKAWDITKGSAQTIVGVVDTGVDYNHPDLAPNIWTATAPYTITLGGTTLVCPIGSHGFNAFAFSCDPMDDHFHGTHVAGTIGARGNNLTGVAGVNWTTSIAAFKFLSAGGQGTTADAIDAIEAAVQMKAQGINIRVLSNSWGGLSFSASLQQAINDASDILFVAAAGNFSGDNDGPNPFYPASYAAPNIVAVAATDNQDKLASFSNFGHTSVHLGAPGVDIESTLLGGGYGYLSGTSMATPHVAGTAALLLSKCSLTTADLKSAILNSVDPNAALTGKTITGGRLNAYRALAYCGASAAPSFTLSASPASMSALAGAPASSLISVALQDGFTGEVALSVTGLPSGVTAVFSPTSRTSSGNSTLTLSTSSTTPAGTYSIIVHGASGSLEYTQGLSLTVNTPNFTLTASPAATTLPTGGSAPSTISIASLFGFNGVVSLTATGMPATIAAAFLPNKLTGAGDSTLTLTAATSTLTGTYLITVQGASGALVHTATLTVTVVKPDFTLSASPTSAVVAAGGVSSSTITVESLFGFSNVVNLTATGMPSGVVATLVPPSVTGAGSSALTLTTAFSTAPGNYPITVTALSGVLTHTATVNLVVVAPLAVATASLATGQIGVPYSQNLTATGGAAPYRWTAISGRLPRGVTLDESTGLISGTPATTINVQFTFQVTDSTTPVAKTAFVSLVLNITDGSITITTASLANGQVGSAYSQTLAATGGTGPYTWTLTGGALPNGLTLNPSTGSISGTPTAPINGPLTFLVTDSNSPAWTVTKVLTLTITPMPLAITTASLANGQVGLPYSQMMTAIGGTGSYTWTLTAGTLPNGLTLNPSTGLIGGAPTAAANATLTFQVTDSGSPVQSAMKLLTLTVTSAPLAIATTSLANGQVGALYSQTMAASGGAGPYTWSIIAGTLPNGLTLNAATGLIGGTPTVAANTQLTFQLSDSELPSQAVTKILTLTVTQSALVITTASLANGQVGVVYSQFLSAIGGTGSYTWLLTGGALPNGLTLNPSTGLIGGTPTEPINSPLTFRVTDTGAPPQTVTKVLTLTVAPVGLTITTASLANGQIGAPYSQTLTATGGAAPYRWTTISGRLPREFTLDEFTGLISGTPSGASITPLIFQVTDSTTPAKTATVSLQLAITDGGFAILTVSLAGGQVGAPYSQMLTASGGVGSYTWSLIAGGTMPNGLTLNPATGQISGTPTATANTSLTFRVTDSSSPAQTATKVLTLVIAATADLIRPER